MTAAGRGLIQGPMCPTDHRLILRGKIVTVSVSCSPIEFIAYTEDVTELIAAYELSYHLFADDSYTRQFDRPKCLQVVSIWCPASAICSSGVRLNGCS